MEHSVDIDNRIMNSELPKELESIEFLFRYQQFILLYESAIQLVRMRLDLIDKECAMNKTRSPIRLVIHRIKDPRSIVGKLKRIDVPLSIDFIRKKFK